MSTRQETADASWTVALTSVEWLRDGAERRRSERLSVRAPSQDHAHRAAADQLVARLSRPFRYQIEGSWETYHPLSYPEAAPPMVELRSWALAGRTASSILRSLQQGAETLAPVEHMVAFERAFLLALHDLAPISARCAGRIGDAELDEALGGLIEAERVRWSLPVFLRRAHEQRTPVASVMHDFHLAVGSIFLMQAVEEAFDIGSEASKIIVGRACDRANAADVDAMIAAVMAMEPSADPTSDRDGEQYQVACDALTASIQRRAT